MTIKSHVTDVYANVTASVIDALAKDQRPWAMHKRFVKNGDFASILPPYNPRTGTLYGGMNVGILWTAAFTQGFDLPYWLTVNQAREIAPESHPLKGTHGTKVLFTKEIEKKDKDGNVIYRANGEPEMIRVNQTYTVFNARQFANLPEALTVPYPAPRMPPAELEELFGRVGANVAWARRHESPHYRPSTDKIGMPPFCEFVDARAAYATLAHEMVHWTMHKDRCDRQYTLDWVRAAIRQKLTAKEAPQAAYDFEELVAELGAAYICGVLGLEPKVRNDSVAYLRRYIKLLGVDPSIIMKASTLAIAGANFILKKGLDGRKTVPQAPDYSSVPKKASTKLFGKRIGRRGTVIKPRKAKRPVTATGAKAKTVNAFEMVSA